MLAKRYRSYVRFFVESDFEVVHLLLQQSFDPGQLGVCPVQLLDLVVEGVVLLTQPRLHSVQLMVLVS